MTALPEARAARTNGMEPMPEHSGSNTASQRGAAMGHASDAFMRISVMSSATSPAHASSACVHLDSRGGDAAMGGNSAALMARALGSEVGGGGAEDGAAPTNESPTAPREATASELPAPSMERKGPTVKLHASASGGIEMMRMMKGWRPCGVGRTARDGVVVEEEPAASQLHDDAAERDASERRAVLGPPCKVERGWEQAHEPLALGDGGGIAEPAAALSELQEAVELHELSDARGPVGGVDGV